VVALELPWAVQRELDPQDTWWPQSCPGLGSGSWSHRTLGGPGAAQVGQWEMEPQDMWWPRSCPGLGSGRWSRRTRGGLGAALGYAVHAEVMDTRERVIYMPRLLSHVTYTRGYLICRVPTVAPGPTSGEAVNPQVGPIFQRPARLS
jgi:hypothetical protein